VKFAQSGHGSPSSLRQVDVPGRRRHPRQPQTLKELRDAAVEAGAKTVYSSSEAADGITELAKAGVSARDILKGGLTGALSLACGR
jgi:hypothetical protein